MTRLLTAAVLAPGLWLLIKRAPGWAFEAIAVVAILIASWECYRMLEVAGRRPFKWLGLAAVVVLILSFASVRDPVPPTVPLIGLSSLAMVGAMSRRGSPAEMLDSVMATLFPTIFVGLGLSYIIGLRSMPGEDGEDLVLLLFLCVIFADTGAYYVGRHLGRRKMAPVLSPKKTWEGAWGGLAGSLIAAALAHFWFYQRLGVWHALALGLALGIAGMLGDLAVSLVKRASGVKDSSGLLPGHGGLLDRTDSLLFAGPLLYYYYLIVH